MLILIINYFIFSNKKIRNILVLYCYSILSRKCNKYNIPSNIKNKYYSITINNPEYNLSLLKNKRYCNNNDIIQNRGNDEYKKFGGNYYF